MRDPLDYLNDVKIDLSQYEDIELNDIEKKKMKKMLRRSIAKNSGFKKPLKLATKVSGIAAVIIVCTLVFGICFPTYGQKIPGFKNVVEFLNRNDEIGGYEENTVPVMKSIKMDGYELNIESGYYNGSEATIFYNVIGKDKLNQNKKYMFEAELDLGGVDAGYGFQFEEGEFIDEYTFAGMVTIYISPENKVLDCKIDFKRLYIDDLMHNFLQWGGDTLVELEDATLDVVLDSSNIEIKEYEINKNLMFNNVNLEVVKAEEYPTEIFIETKITKRDTNGTIAYFIWDSKKGKLKQRVGSEKEEGTIKWKYFLPGKDSEVYLIPYWVGGINKPDRYLLTLEKGVYDIDGYGNIEVLDVYDEDDKTLMRVRTTGVQSSFFALRGEDETEYYSPLYSKDKNILGPLDMEATYVFNKLDRKRNYYIQEPSFGITILNDQIIKIK